jgi:hypothetical protein
MADPNFLSPAQSARVLLNEAALLPIMLKTGLRPGDFGVDCHLILFQIVGF